MVLTFSYQQTAVNTKSTNMYDHKMERFNKLLPPRPPFTFLNKYIRLENPWDFKDLNSNYFLHIPSIRSQWAILWRRTVAPEK